MIHLQIGFNRNAEMPPGYKNETVFLSASFSLIPFFWVIYDVFQRLAVLFSDEKSLNFAPCTDWNHSTCDRVI